MFWVSSGLLDSPSDFWSRRCSLDDIPLLTDDAATKLTLSATLRRFGLPADFIPPVFHRSALAALIWGLTVAPRGPLTPIPHGALSLLLAASGRLPAWGLHNGTPRANRIHALTAQLVALADEAQPRPAAPAPAPPQPEFDPPGDALQTPAPGRAITQALFFDTLLRTARVQWPWPRMDISNLLSAAPALPATVDQAPSQAIEERERAASLVWAWTLLGTPADHPDSPWAFPPAASLVTLIAWLRMKDDPEPGSALDLGIAAHAVADRAFDDPRLRRIMQARAISRAATPLFAIEPGPIDPRPDDVCANFFTLACLTGGFPLPLNNLDALSLKNRLGALPQMVPHIITQRRCQQITSEIASAAIWARHFDAEPDTRLGDIPLDTNPLPPSALAFLCDLFPGNGSPEGRTFNATITRISRPRLGQATGPPPPSGRPAPRGQAPTYDRGLGATLPPRTRRSQPGPYVTPRPPHHAW
jgi:hypothetical protein